MGVDTAGFVTDTQIVAWLNTAQRELCTQGRILLSQWTGATVSGQSDYSVPSDYLEIMACFLYRTTGDMAKRLLPLRPIVERDPAHPTGTPQRAFIHGANVSGNNSFIVILEPIPDFSGTADLEIWGKQLPKTMVSGAQDPEVATQWQDGMVHFAASRCYERLSNAGPHYASLADREFQLWLRVLALAKKYRNPLAASFAQEKILTYTPGYDYD